MARMLLIDLDPDFIYITTKILEKRSNEVKSVSGTDISITEVLVLISEVSPDFIFLDYHFFEHVEESCKMIRGNYTGILVLISENERMLAGYNNSLVDVCMAKPFDLHSLLQILGKHTPFLKNELTPETFKSGT